MRITVAQKAVLHELRTAGAKADEEIPTHALWWWNAHSAAANGRRRAFMTLAKKGIVQGVRWEDAGEVWYLTALGAQLIEEVAE